VEVQPRTRVALVDEEECSEATGMRCFTRCGGSA
jgi:hypothetical protein